jgi:hypothetical protein
MMPLGVTPPISPSIAPDTIGYVHHAKPLWMYFAQLLGATGTAIACLCGVYVWVKRSPHHQMNLKGALQGLVERFPWMRNPHLETPAASQSHTVPQPSLGTSSSMPHTPHPETAPSLLPSIHLPEGQHIQSDPPKSYPLDAHHTLHWLEVTQQWVITSTLHAPMILSHPPATSSQASFQNVSYSVTPPLPTSTLPNTQANHHPSLTSPVMAQVMTPSHPPVALTPSPARFQGANFQGFRSPFTS